MHKVPVAIEERGSDWPEEWPKRLETFPEWLGDSRAKLTADDEHWKAIIDKSYLNGMGIDWTKVRNVMDMKAIYGGYPILPISHTIDFLDFFIYWFCLQSLLGMSTSCSSFKKTEHLVDDAMQICSCSCVTKGVGDECSSGACSKYPSYHF